MWLGSILIQLFPGSPSVNPVHSSLCLSFSSAIFSSSMIRPERAPPHFRKEELWLRRVKDFFQGPTSGKLGCHIQSQACPIACESQKISSRPWALPNSGRKLWFCSHEESNSHGQMFSCIGCEASVSIPFDLWTLLHLPCLVSFY